MVRQSGSVGCSDTTASKGMVTRCMNDGLSDFVLPPGIESVVPIIWTL